jgi:hypothetical protein
MWFQAGRLVVSASIHPIHAAAVAQEYLRVLLAELYLHLLSQLCALSKKLFVPDYCQCELEMASCVLPLDQLNLQQCAAAAIGDCRPAHILFNGLQYAGSRLFQLRYGSIRCQLTFIKGECLEPVTHVLNVQPHAVQWDACCTVV